MESPAPTTIGAPVNRALLVSGLVLLAVGLLCHLLAAQAIGGSYIAYRDHIGGFVILCLVPGAILAGLGWRFWRGRHDITLAALGLLQTVLGIWVYIERFSVHG